MLNKLIAALRKASWTDLVTGFVIVPFIALVTAMNLDAALASEPQLISSTEALLQDQRASTHRSGAVGPLKWQILLPDGEVLYLEPGRHTTRFRPDAPVCLGKYQREGYLSDYLEWHIEKVGPCESVASVN